MITPAPASLPRAASVSRFGTSSELGQYAFDARQILAEPKAPQASPLSIEYAMAVASLLNR